jgi:hypothetical protein
MKAKNAFLTPVVRSGHLKAPTTSWPAATPPTTGAGGSRWARARTGTYFTNNTARRNTVVDLNGWPGTTNAWLDNNRRNTEGGAIPPSVCNPGE